MKYGLALVAIALAATGCGAAVSSKDPSKQAEDQPPTGASLPAPTSSQLCDASGLTYLIGRPRTEIPVPVDPSKRVVACTQCAAPDDYQADRTRITFDAKTGLITSVKCG